MKISFLKEYINIINLYYHTFFFFSARRSENGKKDGTAI